jgi:1,4-alpha-glucan branching enzyme
LKTEERTQRRTNGISSDLKEEKERMDVNRSDIEGIIFGYSKHPFNVLGPHLLGNETRICCFYPDACGAVVNSKSDGSKFEMQRLDNRGFYGVTIPADKALGYTLTLYYPNGTDYETEDPYAFSPDLDEEALELFDKGINYEIYKTLGAKPAEVDGVKGIRFALWAPNASSASVVGDFNLWDKRRSLMEFDERHGVYSLFVPGLENGALYKYAVTTKGGATILKADPYGTWSQKRPDNASVVFDIDSFKWTDSTWIGNRKKKDPLDGPINIYEVHLGSWKKPSEEDGSFYNYRELAVQLCDYVKEMGYTHVELLPIMEHPFDGSWGYQVTGYYAATSRFGSPSDFMYFVNYMHKNGIGVILDWVPAHFPKDAFGLAKFDGTCLYEHFDKRRGEHPDWGTLIYNLERPQVSNFLIANALYWVEQFHADGIRMDAVASMLYLDYGRKNGEWLPNKYGGRENLDAMEFLKHLNSIMAKRNKNVLMIAEESTAWPNVTGVVEENNSLGFTLKWNMGWMNDFLKYMEQDPLFKKGVHGCLTFSMMYAYSEKFILVLSHDEVVHGKGSLLNKMPGEYNDKFANLRAAYGFMVGHPGKKLLFMGQDFGQFSEWNEGKSLDWGLIDQYEMHGKMHAYCKDLFNIYCKTPAFYDMDFVPEGFKWMSCQDADHSIVSFIRRSKKDDVYLFVCNFTPIPYEGFVQAVPESGTYKELINSDDVKYGGTGLTNPKALKSAKVPKDGQENSIVMNLPPLGVVIFKKEKK